MSDFSIPVYWRMHGTNDIHSSNAVSFRGDDLVFDDGGWCPLSSCFLTEQQCRDFHKLPPNLWENTRKKVSGELHRMAEALIEQP